MAGGADWERAQAREAALRAAREGDLEALGALLATPAGRVEALACRAKADGEDALGVAARHGQARFVEALLREREAAGLGPLRRAEALAMALSGERAAARMACVQLLAPSLDWRAASGEKSGHGWRAPVSGGAKALGACVGRSRLAELGWILGEPGPAEPWREAARECARFHVTDEGWTLAMHAAAIGRPEALRAVAPFTDLRGARAGVEPLAFAASWMRPDACAAIIEIAGPPDDAVALRAAIEAAAQGSWGSAEAIGAGCSEAAAARIWAELSLGHGDKLPRLAGRMAAIEAREIEAGLDGEGGRAAAPVRHKGRI